MQERKHHTTFWNKKIFLILSLRTESLYQPAKKYATY